MNELKKHLGYYYNCKRELRQDLKDYAKCGDVFFLQSATIASACLSYESKWIRNHTVGKFFNCFNKKEDK